MHNFSYIDSKKPERVKAELKMGEMLKGTERHRGAEGIGTRVVPHDDRTPPTLAELGLTKNESSRAQLLADLPEDVFEEIEAGNIIAHEANPAGPKRQHWRFDLH